jgi:hypothetical protein
MKRRRKNELNAESCLFEQGIPPGALESEVLAAIYAKTCSPVEDRSKGFIWDRHVASVRNTFGGREKELWSKEFLEEWQEYVEAVERGELRGYML